MAPTEPTAPMTLDEAHLSGCLALSAEAGWNQTVDDWALFMRHGQVFGFCDDDGTPVATGAILPYAGTFAWLSMVLVTAARRRAQLGTRVLAAGRDELARRRLVALLDATPAGERVYRPLGFVPLSGLTRLQGEGGGAPPTAGVWPMQPGDLPAVAALDARAFGAERRFLIDSLFARAAAHAFTSADGSGFVLARPGRIATQIGPLVADNERTAQALLAAALASVAGPAFLDIADRAADLAAGLRRRGFTVQRPFLRMALGCNAPYGDPARLFVAAGPEFG